MPSALGITWICVCVCVRVCVRVCVCVWVCVVRTCIMPESELVGLRVFSQPPS